MCGAKAGGPSTEGLNLKDEAVVQGVVTRDGEPVAGAYVRLLDTGGEVVGMVAEGDLGRAGFSGHPIEDAPTQPRAQRARRRAVVEDVVDGLADVGVLDPKFPAARLAGAGDQLVLVFLVAGIDVDRDQREPDRRPLTQDVERLQQRPAVFAAREPDHDAIALASRLFRPARWSRHAEVLVGRLGEMTDRLAAREPELVADALRSDAARDRGLFREDVVETMLASPNEHRTNLDGSTLWQLGLLELWLQTHV